MRKTIGLNQTIMGLTLFGLATIPAFAAINVIQTSFAEQKWITATTPIRIKLDRMPDPAEGRLVVFVGKTDVTALFRIAGPGELIYQPGVVPLPSGEQELVLYLVRGLEAWDEVARLPLNVLTKRGFEQGEIEPRLDANNESQLNEGHSTDAGEPERSEYSDLALEGGWRSRHRRGDFGIDTGFNFAGASRREAALRFEEEGKDAPKTDLSHYLVELTKGRSSLSVGHIAYGNHRHLLSGVDSRGLIFEHKLGRGLDFSLNNMNGNRITGFDNLLGQEDNDNRITAATIGYELFPGRPGTLRAELMYLDAALNAEPNFDFGEVPDAEESSGFGLNLTASSKSGRLRGALGLARSDYANPDDPFLAQGTALVEVEETTNNARFLNASYDIIKDKTFGQHQIATLTLGFGHERVDPLYKSIGAISNADQLINRLVLDGLLGPVTAQLAQAESENNLDDVPTILKVENRVTSLSLGVPLGELIGNDKTRARWPTLTYGFERVREVALNSPDFLQSGFGGNAAVLVSPEVPDQLTEVRSVDLGWFWDRWGISYRFVDADQDNRAVGQENVDFRDTSHEILFDLRPNEAINFTFGLGLVEQEDKESDLTNKTEKFEFSVDWRFLNEWALSANYSQDVDSDSQSLVDNDAGTFQIQVARRFSIPSPDRRKLPAQAYLRYTLQDNNNEDNTFNFDTRVRTWAVNAGISISAF